MSEIPEWAANRAQELMRTEGSGVAWSKGCGADRALARYIAEHEEPPVDPLPEPLDFSRPLQTKSGEPVKYICADVIEYRLARVCVDAVTGLVYSSPYVGLEIRNAPVDPLAEALQVVLSGFEGKGHARPYAILVRAELAKRGLKIVAADQ